MWAFEIFIVAPIKGGDAGGGVAMGLPLFVLGILFVGRALRYRRLSSDSAEP
jgi:hypothetical protein